MTRVLVVDDDARVRTVPRVLLEEAGLDVLEAGDGVAALRAMHDGGIDLVLCDLFMPDLDGLELLRALRREFPETKVIAMSGGGFGGTVDLLTVARLLGASEILAKPFVQRTLLAAVERTLRPSAGES
jgi:CheY-like chemotaxis protein